MGPVRFRAFGGGQSAKGVPCLDLLRVHTESVRSVPGLGCGRIPVCSPCSGRASPSSSARALPRLPAPAPDQGHQQSQRALRVTAIGSRSTPQLRASEPPPSHQQLPSSPQLPF
ncbi:hypothetical protein NDU88_004094 [Pleurodeles waltl]|uniref:Uncharacterized protein n=1 Tax=Pleurodeles waltl TaxID=8319 RepID=A0AAV7N0J0_PLEWA|nr:hypothetical protein NDU88_004094 [Pleurodeles waltl]